MSHLCKWSCVGQLAVLGPPNEEQEEAQAQAARRYHAQEAATNVYWVVSAARPEQIVPRLANNRPLQLYSVRMSKQATRLFHPDHNTHLGLDLIEAGSM